MATLVTIPYKPRALQLKMHEGLESRRFGLVVAHRRFGKTVGVVNHTIKQAILCKKQDPRYGYIGPFRNQAEQIAWMYLKRYTRPIPGTKINESKLAITLPNKAEIRIYGADNPDAFRGFYFDGVVLDEPGQMKPDIWDEILRPALSDRIGWAVLIGTPKGLNFFHKMYMEGLANPDLWYVGIFDVDHTDALDPTEVEALRREQPENKFRQEMLCDFSANVEDTIIPLNLVLDGFGRVIHPDAYRKQPIVIGVDVARFGDDKSVIYVRQGLATLEIRKFSGVDLYHFSESVMASITNHKPDAVFIDDVGVGAGVVDMLKGRNFEVTGINSGSQARDQMFSNKRAEMWWGVRTWLEAGGSYPADLELREELANPTYSFDPANRIRLEKKEDMKKRSVKSPDIADALALTFAQPVYKRRHELLERKKAWDPWSVLEQRVA